MACVFDYGTGDRCSGITLVSRSYTYSYTTTGASYSIGKYKSPPPAKSYWRELEDIIDLRIFYSDYKEQIAKVVSFIRRILQSRDRIKNKRKRFIQSLNL